MFLEAVVEPERKIDRHAVSLGRCLIRENINHFFPKGFMSLRVMFNGYRVGGGRKHWAWYSP